MKNCKKAISILLAMLMVLSPLTGSMAYAENPYEASVTSGSTTQYYESFEVAASPEHWFEGSTLNLLGDIDTTQSVLVENGAHTLNLNGFGLRASSDTNFSVITVSSNAELTVVNTDNTEHRYTVDSNLLATVNDDATGTEGEDYFTFTGGYITGGKGTDDKGGAVLNNGTFTMTGGNIIGNTALRGGGVYNAGTVNFAGGQILYNYAPGWGGGIYLAEQPANIANVSGGTIAYNLSGNGGGIHVTDGDTLNLSGSPTVLNNMATGNTDNNINVALDGKMAVTGKIENSASIGVRRSQIYGILTESENTDYNDPANFVSDVPNCVIGKDVTTGQLKLHAPYTVTWLNENGDVLETDTGLAEGTVPTYDGETPVKPGDTQKQYIFDTWSPEIAPASGDATYTATYREAPPVAKVGETLYSDFTIATQTENWSEGSTLTLLADIDTTATVTVPDGAHTLDLNGYGLRASGDSAFSVLNVPAQAQLTLVDSGDAVHKYTVGANNIAVVDDTLTGTEGEDYFTFTGGYITGGKGTDDKGGAVLNNGTFTMTGGNIIGNTALRGGGVYNAGTVNFAGGQILYNYAPGWGGGIYLAEQPANIANVSGGTIAYNLSGNGGGIHVTDGDTLNLSGSPTVLNNMATDNTDNNINVALDGKMAVTGKIENSASIGVRRSQIYGILTESENTDYNDPANFVSDVPNCVIGKDVTTGQLKLHAPYTVTWLNENGDVLETDTGLAEGTVPTYDGDTPVKPNDPQSLYLFDSWLPEITVASGDATYTATYREVTPVAKVGDTLFGDIETAVRAENWSEGSTLTLLANIDTAATVTVPDGAHTLDLNGCGLRATGNSDFSVITVPANAELTVVNSTNTKHKYTADSNFLATVNDNATGVEGEDYFTFNGGYITGGKGNSSCGGGINNTGTLNFTAGTIIGNSANKGAGICNYGVSNISGGQIIYNYANGWGGGIYLSDTVANTVNLTGGLIENNNANNGGGIHVSRNDKVNLSGSPVVLNNYSTGNKKNNINLTENAVICITGELDSAATIGIKRSDQVGIITDSENTDYNNAQRFISDSADYVVGKDVATSQLKLHAPYTVTWLNENGDVLETDTGLAEGTMPTYDGETPLKPGDEEHFYTFDGWSPEVAPISSNTTYTATFIRTSGVAKVGDVFYSTFEQAVEAAEQIEGGAAITLLADIDEPYTLSPTQILRVILNGHQFNATAPEGAYRLEETAQGDETVYSVVKLYARVGNTDYESFAEAAEASGGTEKITLLRDMDEPYNIQTLLCADMLSVKADGHTANITDYARTQTRGNVSDYFKTDKEVYVDGEGIDAEDVIVIAAGTAATVVVVEGGEASVVIGTGASVILDAGSGANVDLEPENPDEECLQEEEHEDGSREIKNLKYHVVTIDTGISILDVGAEALPDCVNDMYQTYQQNISSIIKITPPVLSIIGYTDVIIKFPYPEGWFFPPIPYLPEAMNPGSHFIAFFEGTTPTSYGTPFIGKYITEDLDITGIWVPYEAAIEKPNGELEYYLSFCDAAADADGNVVRILSAPLGTYTLKKTHESPVIYETLKVKRGFYTGTCVAAPENLPKGYKMRTWTYKDDDDETVTCYTIDGSIQPNNGVCLTIGSDITSNYYIDYSAYDGATKLVYTYNSVNEKEEYVPVTKEIDLNNIPSELISGGRVKLTVSQAAAQMAEATHIELRNSYGEVLDTLDYSAKTYCDNVTGMSDDALSEYTGSVASAKKLKTLCYSLLAYAQAAQGVFSEYDTTTVVCDNEQVNEQIEDATFEPNYVLDNTGMIKFSTVSFACTKDARLRVYLNTSGATYTPPAPVSNYGKAVLKYRIKDGVKEYFVEVGGIDAADFSKQMTISYGGSQITLSVLDYAGIVLKNSKATQAQKQLAKALIVYNENAQAYFG